MYRVIRIYKSFGPYLIPHENPHCLQEKLGSSGMVAGAIGSAPAITAPTPAPTNQERLVERTEDTAANLVRATAACGAAVAADDVVGKARHPNDVRENPGDGSGGGPSNGSTADPAASAMPPQPFSGAATEMAEMMPAGGKFVSDGATEASDDHDLVHGSRFATDKSKTAKLKAARAGIAAVLKLAGAILSCAGSGSSSDGSGSDREATAMALLVTEKLRALDSAVAMALSASQRVHPHQFIEMCQDTRREAHTIQAYLKFAREQGGAAKCSPASLQAVRQGTWAHPLPESESKRNRGMRQVAREVNDAVAATELALQSHVSPHARAVLKARGEDGAGAQAVSVSSSGCAATDGVTSGEGIVAAEEEVSGDAEALDLVERLAHSRVEVLRSIKMASGVTLSKFSTTVDQGPQPDGMQENEGEANTAPSTRALAVAALVTQSMTALDASTGLMLKALRARWPSKRMQEVRCRMAQEAITTQTLLESVAGGAAVDDMKTLAATKVEGATLDASESQSSGYERLPALVTNAAAAAVRAMTPYLPLEVAESAKDRAKDKISADTPTWVRKASGHRNSETLNSELAMTKLLSSQDKIRASLLLAVATAQSTAPGTVVGVGGMGVVHQPSAGTERPHAVAGVVTCLLRGLDDSLTLALQSIQEEWSTLNIKKVFHGTRQKACAALVLLDSVRGGGAVDDEETVQKAARKADELPPLPSHTWGIRKLVLNVESVAAAADAALRPFVPPEDPKVTEIPVAVKSVYSRWTKKASASDHAETLDSDVATVKLRVAKEELMKPMQLAAKAASPPSSAAAAATSAVAGVDGMDTEEQPAAGVDQSAQAMATLVTRVLEALDKSLAVVLTSVRQELSIQTIKDAVHSARKDKYTAEVLLESLESDAAVENGTQVLEEAKVKAETLPPYPPHAWGIKKMTDQVHALAAAATIVLWPYVRRGHAVAMSNKRAAEEAPDMIAVTAKVTPAANSKVSGDAEVTVEKVGGAKVGIAEALQMAAGVAQTTRAPEILIGGGSGSDGKRGQDRSTKSSRAAAVGDLVRERLEALDSSMALSLWAVQEKWTPDRVRDVFHATAREALKTEALLNAVGGGAEVDDKDVLAAAKAQGDTLQPSPTLGSETLADMVQRATAAGISALRKTAADGGGGGGGTSAAASSPLGASDAMEGTTTAPTSTVTSGGT